MAAILKEIESQALQLSPLLDVQLCHRLELEAHAGGLLRCVLDGVPYAG